MVCIGYRAVGKIEDCYYEGRWFGPVSVTHCFVVTDFSNQHHATCFSRALLSKLGRFMFLCVWQMKNDNPSYMLNA